MVVTVDRGRWGCALGRDPATRVTAMRARELGRTPIVVGDDVGFVGDLSGRTDTLARIVRRGERRTVLRRTADDTDPTERVVVANADQLLIVVALADPPPRTGLVERALIAAYAGGLTPILCLTKTDLAPAEPFAAQFAGPRPDGRHRRPRRSARRGGTAARRQGDRAARALRRRQVHAGESPCARCGPGHRCGLRRRQGAAHVHAVGGAAARRVRLGVDTPGIRSFGLAHIEPDDVMLAFSDLAEAIKDCPRGCGHLGPPADPECALDALTGPAADRVAAARRLLAAMREG